MVKLLAQEEHLTQSTDTSALDFYKLRVLVWLCAQLAHSKV